MKLGSCQKISALSGIGEHWKEKYFHFLVKLTDTVTVKSQVLSSPVSCLLSHLIHFLDWRRHFGFVSSMFEF